MSVQVALEALFSLTPTHQHYYEAAIFLRLTGMCLGARVQLQLGNLCQTPTQRIACRTHGCSSLQLGRVTRTTYTCEYLFWQS